MGPRWRLGPEAEVGAGLWVGCLGLHLSPVCLQHAGDFICTVYLEEKKAEAEQHVKVGAGHPEARLVFFLLFSELLETPPGSRRPKAPA